ncbi:MAG: flagellar basal body L-ring protein FlgH [Planctomycetes bacterium]|nr:flagellar basal body L-ring protein FlgH [Planctomycetota bacterium]
MSRSIRLLVFFAGLGWGAGSLPAQSLWMRHSNSAGPRSLYEADLAPETQFKLNDLILILVEESGTASNNTNTNLRRKFTLDAEVKDFIKLDPADLALRAANSELLPSVDIQSEKKLESRGTTDRREKITFKIMARVVDIRPNGNLIIEGRTTRLVNDEESLLTIFGEVSTLDILPKLRAVRSERIADLKLVYSGNGPVSRNAGRSWFTWILDWIWPF